tara:strand:+ start:227 stop:598 length:372 start_codon:yes stop_codon:yes gene_type:complete
MSKETTETTETAELKKPVKKEEIWTTEEKSKIKSQYGCEMLVENGSLQDVSAQDVPTDAYIVTYTLDDQVKYDLTRGTKTNLFDMYYDKFKQGLRDIKYGQGNISPKLWGYRNKQTGKKKRRK